MKIKAAIRARYAMLSHRQKRIALFLMALVCLLFIILLKSCHTLIADKNKTPIEPMVLRKGKKIIIPLHSPLRLQMKLKQVRLSNDPHIVSFPGAIEADPARTVNVLPPLTGRIFSLNVKLGEVVKHNQLLAVINAPDLAQAYADNDKAKSVLKLTTDALRRAQRVNRAGGNALKDVQSAQSAYSQAFAEANRTQARLKILGNNTFSRLVIKAPISGRITALNYGRGSYINDLTVALLSISNIKMVWVTANVPENLVGVVAKNQHVNIYLPAYPKQVFQGQIAFVNSFLEPDTRCNKTRIALSNVNERLQPNMFATIELTVPQPDLVMIPLSAILMNDDTTSVYVETSPWIFERREVELGPEDGRDVRILSGLKAGERIAASGGIFIND